MSRQSEEPYDRYLTEVETYKIAWAVMLLHPAISCAPTSKKPVTIELYTVGGY